jgi:hypothetical protein
MTLDDKLQSAREAQRRAQERQRAQEAAEEELGRLEALWGATGDEELDP